MREENIFRKYFLKYLFTVISTTVAKSNSWSSSGVLTSYLSTPVLAAEKD